MKKKKIQYVSLEVGAFISDMVFQVMTAEERGVYCTIIFYLYENNGRLPFDIETLKHLCNCPDFEKVWEFVKRKFIIKQGRIYHKRVTAELERAKQFLQAQSEKGIKGNDTRWREHRTAIAQQSPDNRQVTKSEGKRSEVNESNNSNTSSVFQSLDTSLRSAAITAGELETLRFRIYDILHKVFGGLTVSDRTSLRNLTGWVKENIAAGKFAPEIFKTIVNMATESKNGKSRKPIAVFFAQVKNDLGYKKDE
jgi:uncharacterized protein YdaU (DUF1376 family)